MPHCIIEYTPAIEDQISISTLVENVHQSANDSGLFNAASIKTRALCVEHFLLGTGNKGFIHVSIRILAGSTESQKRDLSQRVLRGVSNGIDKGVDVSVEILDIDTPSYAKQVL